MTHVHILRGRNSTSCTFVGGEDILLWENLVLPYACFLGVLWCFVFYVLLLSSHHVHMLNMHTSSCLFGWSFALLCGHCSHFYMTVLVYDQITHMFHIIFTWSQFTWYIILILLLLTLPWGSNMFCASFSGYRYICSKFITAPKIHDRGSDMIGGEREKELRAPLTMFALLIVHDYA